MSHQTEKDLNAFQEKCAKLSIPPDCIPELHYLQKVFRQRLSLFESFVNKVEPKNSVERMRNNILVQIKLTDSLSSRGSFASKEFISFSKYNKLINKKSTLKEYKDYQLKNRESQKSKAIKDNVMRSETAGESLRTNKLKLDLMQAKAYELSEEIRHENEIRAEIQSVTPKSFQSSDGMNCHLKIIDENIEALKKISSVISEDQQEGNSPIIEKYLNIIAEEMINVPNAVLLQMIQNKLKFMMENSIIALFSSLIQTNDKKKVYTQIISSQLLTPLNKYKVLSGIELMSLRKRFANIKSIAAENIKVRENEMDSKWNAHMSLSFQLKDEDIKDDFVQTLIAKLNVEGKNLCCRETILLLKQQINSNAYEQQQESISSETRDIYKLIDKKIALIQEHVAQTYRINEKTNSIKISFIRLIQALKIEKRDCIDSVPIQTKTSTLNLPKHAVELKTFLELQMQQLEKNMDMSRALLMCDHQKLSNLMNPFEYFLYPKVYFNDIEKQLILTDMLKKYSIEIENNTMSVIDHDELERKYDKNCHEISSMLDNVGKFDELTKNHLKNINALYYYGMKNPLRKYIPQSKKYLDKTYIEYEKEYMLYYNMIKN